MLFRTLEEVSTRVSATTKKKEKISLLARFLLQAKGEEIALAAYYLSGRLPQGRLGIGWKMLQEAAEDLSRLPRPLSLLDINTFLESLSSEKGPGSLERKVRTLRELLSHTSEKERNFLIRLIMGEIRQGALEGLLLEAIAQASSFPPELLRQALMFSGDIGEVARVSLEEGAAGLARFKPRLFQPISPMLANPAGGETEALRRLGEAGWEYKIDGARTQVHKKGEEVRIFSRHLKEVTESVPEIVSWVKGLPLGEAIFEGEVIALREDGDPLPFQTTMRRFGRIQDVERMQKEIPLRPFLFDLLYLDGEPLFQATYRERFDFLVERIPPGYLIPRIITADEKEAQDFLLKSLEAGHEGLMAKGLDSPYIAGHRGFYWLKIKPAQTLDLVVLAAEWGHGRRRGWLSNLHLGARDFESGGFVMLGKTFKGLTDEMLQWQTKRLQELEISRDEWTVYVRPALVVEIAFSDLQESPRYPGGLALRFARVRRFREDKSPIEADTFQKIRTIFETSRK
ncbi:MAG: ATP-dependent DNA ligase [Deltaproteobacteria bacterium]|nr:MAG: ATP-dependent DNA ligase [Deltaproteobacteria bacterium]